MARPSVSSPWHGLARSSGERRLSGGGLAVVLLLGCTTPPSARDEAEAPAMAPAASKAAVEGGQAAAVDAAGEASSSSADADAAASPWPLCGVLTQAGYHPEDRLAFVVPVASDGPAVERYEAIDATGSPAPLSVYAGWWLCITKGKRRRSPVEGKAGPEYGLVEIEAFEIDQSTGERGQE